MMKRKFLRLGRDNPDVYNAFEGSVEPYFNSGAIRMKNHGGIVEITFETPFGSNDMARLHGAIANRFETSLGLVGLDTFKDFSDLSAAEKRKVLGEPEPPAPTGANWDRILDEHAIMLDGEYFL